MWTETTKRKAPHKPILLLALLDLVDRKAITAPFVDITANVVELNELFTLYWRKIMPLGQTSSIAFPFSRLHGEAFWELVPMPGQAITRELINNTSWISYLAKYAVGARLDEDLFTLMQTGPGSGALRETLLQTCFSTEAQVLLREQSAINREASTYTRILEQQSHLPLVKEIVEAYQFRPAARDQGFRRLVVSTYNHRCALCGIRIVTPDGHTVVEAAHIVPWSKSKNDDVRNGIALCPTCHWGFDEGMLAVSEDYKVVTSRSIGTDPNFPGLLSMLPGRTIIPPVDRDHWPAPEYLAEHRRQWKIRCNIVW
jgi:putative restriction endonuclease